MRLNVQLITPPIREPVSLAQAKERLRIVTTTEDAAIRALISAARQWCEQYQHRAFMPQTWELWLDDWPDDSFIELPNPPLQSVSSIKYYGTDNTEYTVSDTDYLVDPTGVKGRLILAYSKTWPTLVMRPGKAICVRFVTGYAAYTGTCNTTGTAIVKATGSDFVASWTAGKQITINGVANTIAAVANITQLTVDTDVGNHNGYSFALDDVPEPTKEAILIQVELTYPGNDFSPQYRQSMERVRDVLLNINKVVLV